MLARIFRRLQTTSHRIKWIFIFLSLINLILLWAVWAFLPQGWDWPLYFKPAIIEMYKGASPYSIEGYFNPPWVLVFLTPLLIFSEKFASAILSVTGLNVFAYVAYKLGGKPIAILAFLLSPFVLFGSFSTNIDWMIALGFILPPQIGLFLVLAKPQVGLAVALYWLIKSFQSNRWQGVIRNFSPVSICFLLSFLIYGFWPMSGFHRINSGFNISLWPLSLPIGLVLLTLAFRYDKIGLAIAASPFLSPYMSLHSWSIALLGLFPLQAEMVIAVIASWLALIIKIPN